MADSANFALNLQKNPSIFEITAAEFLDNLIYPALSKIFDYLGLKYEINIISKFSIKDDLSPLVTILLQYLYLKKRGGSLGESFYGMQRRSTSNGQVISGRDVLISASLLTLLPYVEKKLKDRSAQHESSSWEKYLLDGFYIYNIAKAVHTFFYITRFSVSHSPIFRGIGLVLKYPKEPIEKDRTTRMIMKSLEFMAFFLQFLQWWYSNSQQQKFGSLKDPKPLEKNSKAKQEEIPIGICPICIQKIETPTASAVSGYVYCWKCIANHLKENNTCPVTGYPISVEDLVRMYEN